MSRMFKALPAVALVAFSIGFASIGLSGVSKANPDCSDGTKSHQAVGGRENTSSTLRGNRNNVWVNSFGSGQFQSWRAVAIIQSSNNFAETGWITWPGFQAHPYRTWMANGVLDDDNIEWGINLALDQFHEFKIHDSNGDQSWSFAYDGNALGQKTLPLVWGQAVSESERGCTADSLFAHFKEMNKCSGINCSWVNFGGLTQYIDNASGYSFCWRSATHFDVQASC